MHRLPALLACLLLGCPQPAFSHPVPFSYLDLRLQDDAIEGALAAHVIDIAHELGIEPPEALLAADRAARERARIVSLFGARLRVVTDGRELAPEWGSLEALPDRQALRLRARFPLRSAPGSVQLRCYLFPYDPNHQTFVTVYERGAPTHQAILDKDRSVLDYYPGTRHGSLAVLKRFVPAGIHHILVGPDHVLFLVGLLLLGGGIWTLLKIVTAFTLAHSLTLSLAALDILSPPARLIEPAIALSIVYVGADNLLVDRNGRDVRAWIAFFFGLIHGFGFAFVLRESGLPGQALGWSLFSFNLGVEIGQVAIVSAIASLLALVRSRSELVGRRLAVTGSVAVACAGAYWFLERLFLA